MELVAKKWVLQAKKISRILLVDDDESVIFFHKLLIQKLEITDELIIKKNGKEAIDYLREQGGGALMPSLILLDIDMPVMDGYEFLEAYTKLPRQLQVSNIIIVSTSSQYIDNARIVEFPFVQGKKSKPLKRNEWEYLLAKYGV